MKISIVTVTFNSGATVRDTIESVLKQKYQDFEYLVIDGGSKDNTVDIIKEYEPSKFVQTEWKMQDGLYVQYSAYENNTPCVVGDIHSLSLV